MSKLGQMRRGEIVDARGDPFLQFAGPLIARAVPLIRQYAGPLISKAAKLVTNRFKNRMAVGGGMPAASGSVAGSVAVTGGMRLPTKGSGVNTGIAGLLGGLLGGGASGAGAAAVQEIVRRFSGGGGSFGGAGASGSTAAAARLLTSGRRRRRMNPCNAKAAGRAITRLKATHKLLKRIESRMPKRHVCRTAGSRRSRSRR